MRIVIPTSPLYNYFMDSKGKETRKGGLFLVGTPIGNLEDITLRALRTLREVDYIAAEDTRTTRKLLSHYNIHTPVLSYQGYNEKDKSLQIVNIIKQGKKVALVSEAGMPGLSDPGHLAVKACLEEGLSVTVIPGPSSLTAAISLSGMPMRNFFFAGFIPSKKAERRRLLERLREMKEAQVVFESPHRLRRTLEDISELYGEREMVLVKELTKWYEEVQRGSAREVLEGLSGEKLRGEYVLIIGPAEKSKPEEEQASLRPLLDAVEEKVQEGLTLSEACRKVAEREGISRHRLYNLYLKRHKAN